ncbi:MAG: MFS transporter, partial [Acidobacteria bacterium]|nr:MFS transporter [Acidobacteriota bacterium]
MRPVPAEKHAWKHWRWSVCALLFFGTTINYIDRQVFSILAPDLQRAIGWNELEYASIVTAFQAAYGIGLMFAGRLLDRFGTRLGYAAALTFWSIAAMAHAAAGSALGFGAARFALGLGESGNFPAAVKTVAEWFPKKERALATGIFNAGTNVGAVAAPLLVPWLALNYGWRWAFIATGLCGFLWLIFWLAFYHRPEEHPRLTPGEFAYIRGDAAEATARVPWARLLGFRQTWVFALGKFLTDPVWWFYLFWLPKFLNAQYGLTLDRIGPPLVVVYVLADVGSIAGGWLSSSLIKRGWSINAARKTAMLACALAVTPIIFASRASNMWVAVAFFGLATAAHQGFSANLFTLTSDLFPRNAVGSVVGFGGTAGSIGGMLVSSLAGYLLQGTGNYVPLLTMAGSMFL